MIAELILRFILTSVQAQNVADQVPAVTLVDCTSSSLGSPVYQAISALLLQQSGSVLLGSAAVAMLAVNCIFQQKQLVDAMRQVDVLPKNAFQHCLRVDVIVLHVLYLCKVPACRPYTSAAASTH